ncbi:MAG: hypothetical protein EOO73_10295 [Myxococcales bacterium]|nr:MAG: hypothetical protein EOO73_10295 [Myxococcales bacterium]
MNRNWARLARASGRVCARLAFLALWLFASRAHAAAPLPASESELAFVVYPAVTPGPHPVTVVLHGMCGEPLRTCAHFAPEVTKREHLICPRASNRCEGGGASWASRGFVGPIQAAVRRAELQLGPLVDREAGRTLIGYSLGAYRAAALLQQVGSDYRRAMLIGARLVMEPRLFRDGSSTRLVLAAGAWDMTFAPLQREAARLTRAGVTVRFESLGAVGHALTPSFQSHLESALRWLNDLGSVG